MLKKTVIKDTDIIETGEVELSPELNAEVQKRIKQADREIEKRLTERIQVRLSRAELIRCKKRAEELGIPYTTYIRSILKQALDKAA